MLVVLPLIVEKKSAEIRSIAGGVIAVLVLFDQNKHTAAHLSYN